MERREIEVAADGTETGPVLNDRWYGYVYLKNLNKQDRSKLVVPRLVDHLAAAYDEFGRVYLDNVDVGGILVAEGTDPWFLLGILNAPVVDFIFRRVSKPFRGGYLSANRQFIKDLPVPHADTAAQASISGFARNLQRLHTERGRILNDLGRRLDATTRARPAEWLFHGLPAVEDFARVAPASLSARDRRVRGKTLRDAEIARREAAVGAVLRPGARLSVTLTGGELALLADGVAVLDHVFVTVSERAFVHAVWRHLAAITTVSEKTTGKALCTKLRRIPPTTNSALVEGVVALVAELDATDAEIATAETALNEASFALYGLSAEERALVLSG